MGKRTGSCRSGKKKVAVRRVGDGGRGLTVTVEFQRERFEAAFVYIGHASHIVEEGLNMFRKVRADFHARDTRRVVKTQEYNKARPLLHLITRFRWRHENSTEKKRKVVWRDTVRPHLPKSSQKKESSEGPQIRSKKRGVQSLEPSPSPLPLGPLLLRLHRGHHAAARLPAQPLRGHARAGLG
jgi:hypothetical protein